MCAGFLRQPYRTHRLKRAFQEINHDENDHRYRLPLHPAM